MYLKMNYFTLVADRVQNGQSPEWIRFRVCAGPVPGGRGVQTYAGPPYSGANNMTPPLPQILVSAPRAPLRLCARKAPRKIAIF